MSKKGNEILERVLLLMNYDNKMTLNENINVIVEQSEQKKQSFFKKFPCIKTNLDKGIGQITSLDDGSPVYFLNGNFYYNNGRKRVNGVASNFTCGDNVFNQGKTTFKKSTGTNDPIVKAYQDVNQDLTTLNLNQLKNEIINLSKTRNTKNDKTKTERFKKLVGELASRLSKMSYGDLIKFGTDLPTEYTLLSQQGSPSISAPKTENDYLQKGILSILRDYALYEKDLKEYKKNPSSYNYNPTTSILKWDSIIKSNPNLSFLENYRYSPAKYTEETKKKDEMKSKGIVGYTKEGYPDYGTKEKNFWKSLVDSGYLTNYSFPIVNGKKNYNTLPSGVQEALDRLNKKEFNRYVSGQLKTYGAITGNQKKEWSDIMTVKIPKNESDWEIQLNKLRKFAYPEITKKNIENELNVGQYQKDTQKINEKLIKSESARILNDESTGKVYWANYDENLEPIKSTGANPITFYPFVVYVGPFWTVMDDSQKSKFAIWYVDNIGKPGTPNLDSQKQNDDRIKEFFKTIKLSEVQSNQLKNSYPDNPELWESYFPNSPGTISYYLRSNFLRNAIKRDIIHGRENVTNFKDIDDETVNNRIKEIVKNCIGSRDILNKIADGELQYEGRIVGQYYKDLGGGGYVGYKIPCKDKFWDEYGAPIQLGGMLLVAVATAGASIPATAAFWVNILADTALNLTSLKYSIEEQDPDKIQMDLAFLMLPFLFEAKAVKTFFKGLEELKINNETLNEVIRKFQSLPNNYSADDVERLVSSMSREEKEIVSVLYDSNNSSVVNYVNQISDGVKASIKSAQITGQSLRSIKPALITLVIYSIPAINYFGQKLGFIKSLYKKETGKEIREEDLRLLATMSSTMSPEDTKKFESGIKENPKVLISILESESGKKLKEELTGFKNVNQSDWDTALSEFRKKVEKSRNLLKSMKEQYNNEVSDVNKIDTDSENVNYGEMEDLDSAFDFLNDDQEKLVNDLNKPDKNN